MTTSTLVQKSWFRYPVNYFLLLSKVDRTWWRGYFAFLFKMSYRHPTTFLGNFAAWNRNLFLARFTRPSLPTPPVLKCEDVTRAAELFERYGFVVLSNALSAEEAEALRQIVKAKADGIVQGHQLGLLPSEALHGKNRYSFGEYGHSQEWEYLAHNQKIAAILRAIWKGRPFSAVGAGGDFVLPGGTWQPLHSDEGWGGAGEHLPVILTVNYYVSEVLPSCGPLRQIPGTVRYPAPSSLVDFYEPEWMKQSLITGKPGYAIVRDSRGWHGGTPNTSNEPRFMPNLEYVLREHPVVRKGADATTAQLALGKCIAEFD